MADEDTWICCDSCSKWRRVPQSLADGLNPDAQWYCKDSPDPVYNSCDVPQELTDTEIDERTALPVQEEDTAPEELAVRSSKQRKRPPVWQIISRNLYTHRERKRQDEDEIMVCQCKSIWATDTTTIGCGEHCLNRMLNIECVPKFCPCGERCTNQAFSKRQYSKLEIKRAGAKGFGLFTAEDLKPGQFIVEYVGEVLEEEEYARRKDFYTATGQRHYYFMNVGNGEVIDATRRGGLGRFINHSCEPNCETQKWVVKGELSIGLFALQDIPAGTELTFDYNFERYGDKPMKCLCGSTACRGMIGGSQETALRTHQAVVVPEEDDTELEPIMVTEKESDAAVAAILDRAVGLGWEAGWDNNLQRRLEKLASQKGISLAAAAEVAAGEDGESSEDDDNAIAAAALAAVATAAGRRPKSAAKKTRAPRVRQADPDWQGDREVSEPRSTASLHRAPSSTSGGHHIAKRTPTASATPSRSALLSSHSEISRRLYSLISEKSGRLREVSDGTVLQVLRLFNLCDIGPTVSKTGGKYQEGKEDADAHPDDEQIRPPSSSSRPSAGSQGRELTNRQNARVHDALQLLDVIEKTNDVTAGRAFVRCGVLRQLLSCVGPNLGNQFKTIHVKMMLAVDKLPLTADDVMHARSAHGSFADLVRELTRHPNYEVRDKAWGFLKKLGMADAGPPRGSPYGPPPGRGTPMNPHSRGDPRPPLSRFGGGPGGGPVRPPLGGVGGGGRGGPWTPSNPHPGSSGVQHPYSNGTPRSEGPSPFSNGPPPGGLGTEQYPPGGSRKRSRWEMGPPSSAYPHGTDGANGVAGGGSGYGRSPPPPLPAQSQYPYEAGYKYQARHPLRPDSGSGSHVSETGAMKDRPWDSEGNGRDAPGGAGGYYNDRPGAANGSGWGPPLPPPDGAQQSSFARPPSATFSDVSRGSGGSQQPALPPGPPLPPQPEGPVLSPMTDEEEEGEQPGGSDGNGNGIASPLDGYDLPFEHADTYDDDTWNQPDARFDECVADIVRHRLGKYEQPDHPARLSRDDASVLFRQIRREVLAKEQDAFRERQRNGVFKPIERKKLEGRIKDFVRDRVRRFHEKQGGGA